MGWNHRVVTRMAPSPVKGVPPTRLFSITEVYYDTDDDSSPGSYIDGKNVLANWEDIADLFWTAKKVLKAFKKPVLDLDHWPKEYKPKKKKT